MGSQVSPTMQILVLVKGALTTHMILVLVKGDRQMEFQVSPTIYMILVLVKRDHRMGS